jgi:release factor glutamine methyltransferase
VDLEEVAERLRAIGCVAAEEEACELADSAHNPQELADFLNRRSQGEPLAWITGRIQFCGHRLHVAPGVYVPRFESEELARRAAAALALAGGRAVDLCTGTGAIASVLIREVPEAVVIGVEVDRRAAACAQRNDVPVIVADMGEPLRSGVSDVVTAIAPYVPTDQLEFLPADVQRYEPRLALDGGEEGLDLLRRVVSVSARLLQRRGYLFIELGGDQDRRLAPALRLAGFEVVDTWCDEDGDLRGLAAQLVR